MSIWIPRTTSGFDSESDSLKIGGVCYKAVQKNVTKSQAELAETYNASTHGSIGEKFEDCEACGDAEATWGIVGFHLVGFGLNTWPMASMNDLESSTSEQYDGFIDEILSRKSGLTRIEENPTATTFTAEFDLESPDSVTNDWKSWQQDPSMYAYGGNGAWELFTMIPTSLGIVDLKQSGLDINTTGDVTYDYRGVTYDIKILGSSLAEDVSQEGLSFSVPE